VPEGPEVKVVTDGLRERILDRTIVSAQILSGRYSKKDPEGWSLINFPITVSEVGCKGKFIYVSFGDSLHMFNTLGMTGGWSETERKHSRVRFDLDDGGEIYFNDTRNFGTIKLVSKKSDLRLKLASLGPDMLSEDVSVDLFEKRLKRSNKTIVETLMDQSIVSGVGNYLKSECLYFSKISPHRNTQDLSKDDIKTLNTVIKSVIRKSYETGGATIYTFSGFDGQNGDYSRRFAVYNQCKDPEGREVKRETTRDGRTTFWIPDIQK
jgi:formamidopyrimidine-DNA glycosylase